MDIRDAAAIVGVPQDATIEQVRDGFRSHARLLHPDRLGEASQKDQQTAHAAMVRINDAYAVFQAHLRVADGAQERRPSTTKRTDSSSEYPRREAPPDAAYQQSQEGRRDGRLAAQCVLRQCNAPGLRIHGERRGIGNVDDRCKPTQRIHHRVPVDLVAVLGLKGAPAHDPVLPALVAPVKRL